MQKDRSVAPRRRSENKGKPSYLRKAFKGGITGLIVTIVSVLIFAILVKQFKLSDGVISAVNQMIKVMSILIAAYLAACNAPEKKVLAGTLAGVIFVVLGYLTFSLIESQFGKVTLLVADIAMGAVIGMLAAMIVTKLFANKKSKKK